MVLIKQSEDCTNILQFSQIHIRIGHVKYLEDKQIRHEGLKKKENVRFVNLFIYVEIQNAATF